MPLYVDFPSWIRPEIFEGFPLRWYGVMYIVAALIAYFLFLRQIKEDRLDISKESVGNMFLWAVIGLLIGGRLFYALVYDPEFTILREPWRLIWPIQDGQFVGLQGMSYHGGLIGAIVAVAIYTKRKKYSFLQWGDLLANAVPLGYTFGRLGNFINGELYGRAAVGPWGMIFPSAKLVPTNSPWLAEFSELANFPISGTSPLVNVPRHPSQLYEAFLEGILLWVVMWFVVRRISPFRGFAIAMYLIGYGVARFIAEYSREPDAQLGYILRLGGGNNPTAYFTSVLDISMGQILCLLMILAGIVLIFVFRQLHLRRPAVTLLAEDSPKPEPKAASNPIGGQRAAKNTSKAVKKKK